VGGNCNHEGDIVIRQSTMGLLHRRGACALSISTSAFATVSDTMTCASPVVAATVVYFTHAGNQPPFLAYNCNTVRHSEVPLYPPAGLLPTAAPTLAGRAGSTDRTGLAKSCRQPVAVHHVIKAVLLWPWSAVSPVSGPTELTAA